VVGRGRAWGLIAGGEGDNVGVRLGVIVEVLCFFLQTYCDI
jgi:hypothetical protein